MRNLVYMAAFGREEYKYMTTMLLESIRVNSNLNQIDIIIYCDSRFSLHINSYINAAGINAAVIEKSDSEPHTIWASWRRYDIFNVVNLNCYNNVLYLDIDILATGDISKIFHKLESSDQYDCLAFNEHGYHVGDRPGEPWYGYDLFAEYNSLEKNIRKRTFTTAVLCFRPTEKIRRLFAESWEKYLEFRHGKNNLHGFLHCDQPYLNYVGISTESVLADGLNEYVANFSDTLPDSLPLILHFAGGIGKVDKLSQISSFATESENFSPEVRRYAVTMKEIAREREISARNARKGNIYEIKKEYDAAAYSNLIRKYGPNVRHGPFGRAGMKYNVTQFDGESSSLKLLGLYESCLHPVINDIAERKIGSTIIDIGCSEGYYTAGMGRLLNASRIFAFDTSPRALAACKALVEDNCPAANLALENHIDIDKVARMTLNFPSVLFMDNEGDELEFLDPARAPGLRSTEIVVECHEFIPKCRDIVNTLFNRFESSHVIRIINEHDITPSEIPEIENMRGIVRSIICCEMRPVVMRWLHMKPR